MKHEPDVAVHTGRIRSWDPVCAVYQLCFKRGNKWAGNVAQCEALSLTLSTTKRKKKEDIRYMTIGHTKLKELAGRD